VPAIGLSNNTELESPQLRPHC